MAETKWERLEPTFSLEDERLASLNQIVPEAFTDGKVDFERLKELLGEVVEDESAEHFGLNWTGKREARRLAGMPSKGTLVPVPGKGLHEDTTENIFIEGDNLEVLKLLHKSYRGKIKMIYIDPPYNTGNDFIYKDDYRMPLESYLQRSGQKSDMGELLTSNPKSSGRFHSDWLNMMYPRLRVAKDLLKSDGVVFVSIDDNEVNNLRLLMNETFGEENFLANIVWQKRTSPDARLFLGPAHDYIVVYANDRSMLTLNSLDLSETQKDNFKNPDEDPRGPWVSTDFSAQGFRPNQMYEIIAPSGQSYFPPESRCWKNVESEFLRLKEDGRMWFGKNGDARPRVKTYLNETEGVKSWTWWPNSEVGHNQEATKELSAILGSSMVFDTPKPVRLLRRIVQLATSQDGNDIALDFFSGSGTTAHAIAEQNIEDGGNRRFICVQIGEKVPEKSEAEKAGFKTISEITAERIRRVMTSKKDGGLKFGEDGDLGFSCYRLEHSNFKAWTDYQGNDLDELRGLLQAQLESTFVEGATEDAILTEILLLEGFPLTSKIEIDETFQKNAVRRISHEWSEYRLFVTLDKEIQEETIRTVDDMIASDEMSNIDIFICLDNALTDQDKLRLADVCRLKTI